MGNVAIEGNYPTISRQRTGLFSFDMALRDGGKLGVPMRTLMEMYGYPNVGKSSLSYYLAGKLTGEGKVGLLDLEMCDREYVRKCLETSGLDGAVNILSTTDDKGNFLSHENLLLENSRQLYNEDYGVTILDSVGHITPNVEQEVFIKEKEKELGQAFMGKRAKLVGQYCRAIQAALRNKKRPSLAIVINHVHKVMGGVGHSTAGGEVLKYTAAERIMLWPGTTYYLNDDKDDPTEVLGFLVRGQVEKLRYGGRGRKFQFYIVPGYGVHEGATAMFDCLEYGFAESKATVKIGDTSFGYLKATLLTAAAEGNTRKFVGFQEELEKQEESMILDKLEAGNGDKEDTNAD